MKSGKPVQSISITSLSALPRRDVRGAERARALAELLRTLAQRSWDAAPDVSLMLALYQVPVATHARLFHFDAGNGQPVLLTSCSIQPVTDIPRRLPPAAEEALWEPLLRQVVAQREMLVLDQESLPARDASLAACLERIDVETLCAAPVKSSDDVWDILVLSAPWPGVFQRDDLDFVRAVVDYLTLVRRLQRLSDQAAAGQREKSEFIDIVSHELKSPLTSIKGYAQLLLRQSRTAEKTVDVRGLEIINQQVNRMSQLVGRFLDISRLERDRFELHPRAVDLVALVRGKVEQTLGDRLFTIDSAEEVLVTNGDPARIEQALDVLLDNAVRYSPDGGPIAITLTRVADRLAGPGVVAPGPLAPATNTDYALVTLRDHGIGVPPDERRQIFGPFIRGANADHRGLSGLGLGLAIARGIVHRHGGAMGMAPAEPNGSIFWFTLPLVPAPPAD